LLLLRLLLLLLLLLLLAPVTNPDMLHQSILPFHSNFSRLLAKLAYVVVDEGHAYRCDACWYHLCCALCSVSLCSRWRVAHANLAAGQAGLRGV
jgi:hypothetical protein